MKSLSAEVIAHVKEIFNDDYNENIYFATIPAMIKTGNTVQIVQRIWLGQYEKMKTRYRNQGKWQESASKECIEAKKLSIYKEASYDSSIIMKECIFEYLLCITATFFLYKSIGA